MLKFSDKEYFFVYILEVYLYVGIVSMYFFELVVFVCLEYFFFELGVFFFFLLIVVCFLN